MAKPKKQLRISATDGDRNKKLDEQIEKVAELTEQWRQLGVEMTNEREKLLDLMRAAGLREYHALDLSPPYLVTITDAKEKVKLKKESDDDGLDD